MFLLLKGLHILQGTVRIRNVTKLTPIGVGPEDKKIQCEGLAGLYFKQVIPGNFTISNLMFPNELWSRVNRSPTLWCCYPKHCVWFEPDHVIVENSAGYGLLEFNVLGNPLITPSIFRYNRTALEETLGFVTYTVVAPSLKLQHFTQFTLLKTISCGILLPGLWRAKFCTNVSVYATKPYTVWQWRILWRNSTFCSSQAFLTRSHQWVTTKPGLWTGPWTGLWTGLDYGLAHWLQI